MNIKKIRVAITGANGRMGRKLIQAVQQSSYVALGAAIVRSNSSWIGKDAGKMVGIKALNITINDDLVNVKNEFDILIDFSNPEATIKYLLFCCKYKKKMVIGTTGFSNDQKKVINDASKKISIVFSANFSIGINLMLKLLEKASKIIGKTFDIEILEAHHRNKADIPSGTALEMGEYITKALGYDFDYHTIHNNNYKKKQPGCIGFSTMRAGDILGEHTAIFAGIGERLEIAHKTSSRMIFATGAIQATIWLKSSECGLFNMINVLSLDRI